MVYIYSCLLSLASLVSSAVECGRESKRASRCSKVELGTLSEYSRESKTLQQEVCVIVCSLFSAAKAWDFLFFSFFLEFRLEF